MTTDRTTETAARQKIATREEWAAAREALLAREKEHTRLGDELARQRRELPWVRVEKKYTLETAAGDSRQAEFPPIYCNNNTTMAQHIVGIVHPPAQ